MIFSQYFPEQEPLNPHGTHISLSWLRYVQDMISIPDVHSFLEQFYHPAIVDLCAEFPTRQSLVIDCDDIESYDEGWVNQLRDNPRSFIDTFEKGIATYPLKPPYGKLSFESGETELDEPPFVRIQNYPDESVFDELPKLDGTFISTTGRVTKMDEPEARVATAVFVCSQCGDRFSETLVEGYTREAPSTCKSCNREDVYRFSGRYSTFADSQTVTLSPLSYQGSTTITVELRDELIDAVKLNSGVTVSGIVHCTGLSERWPDITILANTVEQTQDEVPHPEVPYTDQFLDEESANNNEFRHKLEEFVDRSRQILKYQSLTEEDAQAKIITPFIHLLGWNVYSDKVRLEYSTPESAGKPDYMLFDASGKPRIPVEAKSPNKNLDEFEHQIERYLKTFTSDVGLLTTGGEYRLYESPSTQDSDVNHLFTLQLSELPANESIVHILREGVVSNTESVSAAFPD